jgi:hypothetical protein
VTWANWVDPIVAEPHTIAIADKDALPDTIEELFAYGGPGTACEPAAGHFDAQQQNPVPGKEVLNAGPPGLDENGDSLFLPAPEEAQPAPTLSATVSAPPATRLFYLCAIHPWMQGGDRRQGQPTRRRRLTRRNGADAGGGPERRMRARRPDAAGPPLRRRAGRLGDASQPSTRGPR